VFSSPAPISLWPPPCILRTFFFSASPGADDFFQFVFASPHKFRQARMQPLGSLVLAGRRFHVSKRKLFSVRAYGQSLCPVPTRMMGFIFTHRLVLLISFATGIRPSAERERRSSSGPTFFNTHSTVSSSPRCCSCFLILLFVPEGPFPTTSHADGFFSGLPSLSAYPPRFLPKRNNSVSWFLNGGTSGGLKWIYP